jgi:hypothetical protein
MWNTLNVTLERLRAILLVLVLAPIAVATSSLRPAWDELFFLHNDAIGHARLSQLNGCLSQMAKSPIMAFLLAPAGVVQGRIYN